MRRNPSQHVSQHPAAETAAVPGPTVLDAATIDFYLRRGRRERARAFAAMIRGIFSSPSPRPSCEVHELPRCGRPAAEPTAGCADRTDRAA